MGGCASKPKGSDILETSATTKNAVVESKNVEPEVVAQEKADEVVAVNKEESAGDDEAKTHKDSEPTKEAEAEPVKSVEAELVKPVEEVKTETAQEAAVIKIVDEKASGETEQPKEEEKAATANDTKTNEEPLITF